MSRHIKLEIQGLFCDQVGLVFEYWTRISATTGKPEGWHPERAAADLLVASGAQSWSPAGRARGRGCWLDDRGHLVVHVGDAVLHDGEWKVPGKIGDMVYLAGEPVMRPAAIALPGQLGGPGQVVLDLFSRWNFSRKIDERLMLGMFVGDFLSGALPWRVAMWIYGEKETGKSTLIDTKEALSGGWQLGSEDSTAAGIWQLIGYDALSLALDEAGDDAEPRRVIALLRLVRVLTGRGNIIRGGADHQGHQFTVGSSITLSSILRPPMLSQDASRIVPIQVLKPKASLPQPAPELCECSARRSCSERSTAGTAIRPLMGPILPPLRVSVVRTTAPPAITLRYWRWRISFWSKKRLMPRWRAARSGNWSKTSRKRRQTR